MTAPWPFALLVLSALTGSSAQVIKVTSIEQAPFLTTVGDEGATGNDRFQGYCKDLTVEIGKELGRVMEMQLVRDGGYGSKNPEGQWNGMVGELVSGAADIAVAPLTISKPRTEVVHFTEPILVARLAFLQKLPKSRETRGLLATLASPFTLANWTLILLSVGLSFLSLWLVSVAVEDDLRHPVNTANYLVATTFFLTPTVQPVKTPVRVASYFWLLFRIIIAMFYIASLVNIVRSQTEGPDSSVRYRSFDDFLGRIKGGDFRAKVFMTGGGSTEASFRNSEDNSFYKHYISNKLEANGSSDAIGKMKCCYEDAIVVGEMPFLKNNQGCDTLAMLLDPDSMQSSPGYGIAVKKENVQLVGNVSSAVERLREKGRLRELEKKWWGVQHSCDSHRQSGKGAATVVVTWTAYLVILVLVLAALGTFAYIKLHGGRQQPEDEAQSKDAENGNVDRRESAA